MRDARYGNGRSTAQMFVRLADMIDSTLDTLMSMDLYFAQKKSTVKLHQKIEHN